MAVIMGLFTTLLLAIEFNLEHAPDPSRVMVFFWPAFNDKMMTGLIAESLMQCLFTTGALYTIPPPIVVKAYFSITSTNLLMFC
jgi:hypothetical protein